MKRDQERNGYRHARLEALLLDELRSLLQDEVRDPVLYTVRPTGLRLSVDYRSARIDYVIVKQDDVPADCDEVQSALERASSFLRYQLAQGVELKRTPELRFVCQGEAAQETRNPLGPSSPPRDSFGPCSSENSSQRP